MLSPSAITFDDDWNTYIADTWNYCVRYIGVDSFIHTVAGTCTVTGYSGDGGPATSATFGTIFDLAVHPTTADLYIIDYA